MIHFIKDHDRQAFLPREKSSITPKINTLNDVVSVLRNEKTKRLMCDDYTSEYFRVVLNWLEAETGYLPF